MDPALVAEQWINAVEVVPGNASIVHHVTVLVDPTAATAGLADATGSYECFSGGLDGTVLAYVWAPGTQPLETPELSGIHVPVGARVVVQVHYHSNAAKDEVDNATTVRLRLTDIPPQRTLSFAAFGATTPEPVGLQPGPNDPGKPFFLIPGGAVGHRETFITQLNLAAPVVRLFSVWPHMHLVGTDMKIELTRVSPNAAQPPQECLVQTPRWDFHLHGVGRVKHHKTLNVKIPVGVDEGDRIRISGEGEAGLNGGPPGDLYVVVHLSAHSVFRRGGNHLHCEIPISFSVAALGGEIEVTTLEGHAKIKVPAETQTGKIFRLRNKGIKGVRSHDKGDLLCHVVVETQVKLTVRQKELLEEVEAISLTDGSRHSPRAKSWMEKAREFFSE